MKNDLQNRISNAISQGVKLGLDLYDDNILDINLDNDLQDILKLKGFVALDPYKCLKDWHVKKFIQGDMSYFYILKHLCCNYSDEYFGVYQVENNLTFLHKLIEKLCSEFGDDINLNWIDISNMTSLKYLFFKSEFNGDISLWNTTRVRNMSWMFANNHAFLGDISRWDVSHVFLMSYMFCNTDFNGDISRWDVSNVTYMESMFSGSRFNSNISEWNVSHLKQASCMFANSLFDQDISKWELPNLQRAYTMYINSKIREEYKPEICKECFTIFGKI